jgi:hypothetical protein
MPQSANRGGKGEATLRLPALAGALAITLATLPGCADQNRRPDAGQSAPSLSVPVPAEEVALTAPVTRVLGPHAIEVGETPTLVIVLDGVPPSVRPGVEVQGTGSVRVFREDLGVELGIPLSGGGIEQFQGTECLVVARLILASG